MERSPRSYPPTAEALKAFRVRGPTSRSRRPARILAARNSLPSTSRNLFMTTGCVAPPGRGRHYCCSPADDTWVGRTFRTRVWLRGRIGSRGAMASTRAGDPKNPLVWRVGFDRFLRLLPPHFLAYHDRVPWHWLHGFVSGGKTGCTASPHSFVELPAWPPITDSSASRARC